MPDPRDKAIRDALFMALPSDWETLNSYLRGDATGVLNALVPVVRGLVEQGQTDALDRCRAVMIRALDALESDSELDARREAFEMIQEQFENVSVADHDRAEALIPQLQAAVSAPPEP